MKGIIVTRSITTSRAVAEAERSARGRRHPKMVLRCGNLSLTVPYAPATSTTTGFGSTWSEVPRPGLKPLLLRQGFQLERQNWELFFGYQDYNRHVDKELNVLTAMSKSSEPVRITYGPGGTKTWHITSLSIETLKRAQQSNQVSRAVASIELTETSAIRPAPGPVRGGVKPPAVVARPRPSTGVRKAPARTHTVSRGQTLSAISNIYYRTPTRWPEIAKANRIRNANRIEIGQKLRIP